MIKDNILISKESMSPSRYGSNRKSYDGYRHKGARHYLKSKVGQDWNNVWADICKAPKTCKFKKYLRQNIGWWVDRNTSSVSIETHYPFYVDPVTNKLVECVRPKYKRAEPLIKLHLIDSQYYWIDRNGIFYKVYFSDFRMWPIINKDHIMNDPITGLEASSLYGFVKFCSRKEQLTSKELKEIKKKITHVR